jgi:hypothetical protein
MAGEPKLQHTWRGPGLGLKERLEHPLKWNSIAQEAHCEDCHGLAVLIVVPAAGSNLKDPLYA